MNVKNFHDEASALSFLLTDLCWGSRTFLLLAYPYSYWFTQALHQIISVDANFLM